MCTWSVGKSWLGRRDPSWFNCALNQVNAVPWDRAQLGFLCKPLPCLPYPCHLDLCLSSSFRCQGSPPPLPLSASPQDASCAASFPPSWVSQLTEKLPFAPVCSSNPRDFLKIISVFTSSLSNLSPCLAIPSSSVLVVTCIHTRQFLACSWLWIQDLPWAQTISTQAVYSLAKLIHNYKLKVLSNITRWVQQWWPFAWLSKEKLSQAMREG